MIYRLRSSITLEALTAFFLYVLLLIAPIDSSAHALTGQWYASTEKWTKDEPPKSGVLINLERLEKLPRTGGDFLYVGYFETTSPDRYVVDFANTAYLKLFEHRIYDNQGVFIASYQGGIWSKSTNLYPLRHGRPLTLAEGQYTLVTNLSSTFFITPPEPFISKEAVYLNDIKVGNFISFMGLGIFFSMACLYLFFTVSRRDPSDLAYTIFIIGNLLFFSVSLNIAPDVFGTSGFQFATRAISISNIAYLFFVRSLFQVKRENDPALYWTGIFFIAVFILFIILSSIFKNWAIEFSRISVVIFLGYGFFTGLTYALQKVTLAYYYLIANLCFLVPAFLTISSVNFNGPTLYSSHIGVIAVSLEMLLLSLLQTYKIKQINLERLALINKTEYSQKVALTDSLTGAPNRNAFEEAFARQSKNDSVIYINLKGLKYYNDSFGHHRGDDLLREFSILMMSNLDKEACFFRIAGNNFSVISPAKVTENVSRTIDRTIKLLKKRGFTLCGVSYSQATELSNPIKAS